MDILLLNETEVQRLLDLDALLGALAAWIHLRRIRRKTTLLQPR